MVASFRSLRSWAVLIAATPGWASVTQAQYPPEPPTVVRLTQLVPIPDPQPVLSDTLPAAPGLGPIELPPTGLAPVELPENETDAYARGPVHEAFADVYEGNPTPSEIVTLQPPEAVDELPPEQAPTGENVQWIPGYWAWDVETKDHMWVSGVWRDVPPGRRWVPGYWATVTGGYQWVSGFWSDARAKELAYVPEPPQTLEVGPNIAAPTEEHVWIPGCWNYVNYNYRWTPGYWDLCQTDYMWVPAQYVWTPRGCIYVPGYRDYRFARRGLLFCPVRFRHSYAGYGRPWFYRPRHVVSLGGFAIHLFVRPRVRHLYYGDFYGNQYAQFGFSPWYRHGWSGRHYHDPVLDFYRVDSRRQGVDFFLSVNTWHQRYATNVDLRPPHMIRDQDAFMARHRGDRTAELAVLTNRLDDVVRQPRSGQSFRQIDARELDAMRDVSRATRTIELARRQGERDGLINPTRSDDNEETGPRGQGGTGRDIKERGRLVLGDLPESVREKTRESIGVADDLQRRVDRGERDIRVIGRNTEGDPAVVGPGTGRDRPRDVERPDSGLIDERMKKRDEPSVGGGDTKRGDGSSRPDDLRRQIDGKLPRDTTPGRTGEPGTPRPGLDERPITAQDRSELLRQQIEARKAARDADVEARRPSGGTGPAPGRVIEPRPERPSSEPNPRGRGESSRPDNGGIVNPQRPDRVEDPRQRVDERKAPREVPVERTPVPREKSAPVPPRREPAPVPRMERPPVERAPVERAPREVPQRTERAPVERAPREVPQRTERAPVERAPVERAPRDSGSSRKRGKD